MSRAANIVAGLCLMGPMAGIAHAEDTNARVKLAVLDLSGQGVPPELVASLTEVVTASLSNLGVFDVLSRSDIQQMLQFEEDKQMLGCESDTSCLAEIGGALGVALLVNGTLGQVGSNYIVNLTLTDTAAAEVRSREQRQVANIDDLPREMEGAAQFLVRELLAGQQGYLVLTCPQSAADVEIDGRLIGVTPLARQELSGGPHKIRVIKKGFITWARDIDIDKEQTAIVDASMVPSVEFIDEYDGRADAWRLAAYLTGGLGIAAVTVGAGLWIVNDGEIQRFNRELQDADCHTGATNTLADCSEFEQRRGNIDVLTITSRVAAAVGVVAVGVATFLFFQGPEPGVYDRYRPAVSAVVVPLDGGAVGVLRADW